MSAGACVAHTSENGRQEQGEGVQRHEATHVDDRKAPALPVLERSIDVATVVLFRSV